MALIKCPECGSEVSDKALSCPKCAFPINKTQIIGEEPKKNKGKWNRILYLVSIFLFFAYLGRSTIHYHKALASRFTLMPDWEFASGQHGDRIIHGKIQNNTSRTFSHVQVQFDLYDANDNRIGNSMANTNNLEGNKVWQFEALVTEEKAKKAKLKEITGY